MTPLRSRLILIITLLLQLTSCHSLGEEWADDPRGNFEALWSILDTRYCFFDDKGVDWDEVHTRYAPRISPRMTREELFEVCSEMLGELRDGHVNLSAPFATYYYTKWWSDYPQDFSLRLIEQSYFNFSYRRSGGLLYGMLDDNVGYIYIASFATSPGESSLDAALSFLSAASGLIIDVRDNGGGMLTGVETLVSRFIDEPMTLGYIAHKTGPGHHDFSDPYPVTYRPAPEGRVRWGKPIVVLTNRSTFSAANNFVSVISALPRVRIVGATTGGGSGIPFSSELPCGWGVRFSACPMYDARMHPTEQGIHPDIPVTLSPTQALSGIDTILDRAITLLTTL